MNGFGVFGIMLAAAVACGSIIGTPPTLDYLEDIKAIDLPEENPVVFNMERFGEAFRERLLVLNLTEWREMRLNERMGEYVDLFNKSQSGEFTEDMKRNMEYIWSEIESRTNMTRDELIEAAKEKLRDEMDKLRQIATPEDCEIFYGDEPRIQCTGRWKLLPVGNLTVCYWACN